MIGRLHTCEGAFCSMCAQAQRGLAQTQAKHDAPERRPVHAIVECVDIICESLPADGGECAIEGTRRLGRIIELLKEAKAL